MFVSIAGSSPAQLTNPSEDGFSAARNPGCPNPAIFFEWALGSHGSNADPRTVFFEEQLVTGANTQGAANLLRHGYLPLPRDTRLLLHCKSPLSLLYPKALTVAHRLLSVLRSCADTDEQDWGNSGARAPSCPCIHFSLESARRFMVNSGRVESGFLKHFYKLS